MGIDSLVDRTNAQMRADIEAREKHMQGWDGHGQDLLFAVVGALIGGITGGLVTGNIAGVIYGGAGLGGLVFIGMACRPAHWNPKD